METNEPARSAVAAFGTAPRFGVGSSVLEGVWQTPVPEAPILANPGAAVAVFRAAPRFGEPGGGL